MVARPFRCEESRLKSFLNDDLPELEHAELTAHLDDCSACRRTLDRLTAGSRLWGELAQLGTHASETGAGGRRRPARPACSRDARPTATRASATECSTFWHLRTFPGRWAGWARTRSRKCWAAAASASS